MSSGTAVFVIDGEWLTNLTRSMWADELNTEKAVGILVDGLHGMTDDIAVKILTGKSKLVGKNEDVHLEDDDATESEQGNTLALKSVMKRVTDRDAKARWDARTHRELLECDVVPCASPVGLVFAPRAVFEKYGVREPIGVVKCGTLDLSLWEEIYPHCITRDAAWDYFVEEKDNVEWRYMICYTESVPNIIGSRGSVNRLLGIDADDADEEEEEEPKPEPAEDFSERYGWITPEGRFYTCGYGGHLALVDRLGFSSGREIEKTHVKVGSLYCESSIYFVGDTAKMPERQKTAIYDWCQHHKEKMPDWVFEDDGL